jgi:hypothetical protein
MIYIYIYIYIELHKDWFSHSKDDWWDTQTYRQHGDCICLLSFFQNKESRLRNRHRRIYDISWSMKLLNEKMRAWHQRATVGRTLVRCHKVVEAFFVSAAVHHCWERVGFRGRRAIPSVMERTYRAPSEVSGGTGEQMSGTRFEPRIQSTVFQSGNEVDKRSQCFTSDLLQYAVLVRLTSHNVWRFMPSGVVLLLMRRLTLKLFCAGVRTVCKWSSFIWELGGS